MLTILELAFFVLCKRLTENPRYGLSEFRGRLQRKELETRTPGQI